MSNEWTEDELESFQAALDSLPYASAMLQNDDLALSSLFEAEQMSLAEVATGMFCLCTILVDLIADQQKSSRMDVVQQLGMFLTDALEAK